MVWLWNRHRRCQRLLSAYLDGEVTAPERRKVDEHLSECGECASYLEELKGTVALLRELPDLPVPRSFALEREPVPAGDGTGLLRAARLATAAAGSLAAAMLVGSMAVGVLIGGADDSESAMQASDVPAAAAEAAAAPIPVPQAPVSKAAPAAPAAPAAAPAPAPTVPAAAMEAAPALAVAAETSPTPVAAAMAAPIAETAKDTEEAAAAATEDEETPAPSPSATPLPSPTVTPAPVGVMPQAVTDVSTAADDPRPEEEPRSGTSWRLPAAMGGLLILFTAATGWLTVLIRRRSP